MNRATVGGLVAILLWSGTVALARSAAEAVGPVTAAAAACGVGGLLSLGSLAGSGARRRSLGALPRRYLLGCGALFVAYMLLLFLAIGSAADRAQTLTVGLLNYLWPPLTIVLSVVLLGRRANRLLGPGLVLALGGHRAGGHGRQRPLLAGAGADPGGRPGAAPAGGRGGAGLGALLDPDPALGRRPRGRARWRSSCRPPRWCWQGWRH